MNPADPAHSLSQALPALVADIEVLRGRYLRWLLAGVAVICCAVTALVYALEPRDPSDFVIIFGSLLLCLPLAQTLAARYHRQAKQRYIAAIARVTGWQYAPKGIFSAAQIRDHKILPTHDRAEGEDGLSGAIDGVPVTLQDMHLYNWAADHERHHSRVPAHIFHGTIMRIKLPRALTGHTVLMPENVLMGLFNGGFSGMATVNLPPRFAHDFATRSTDQIEARLILDPAFMERVQDAAKGMNARWLALSFKDDEILIAVQRPQPLLRAGSLWRPATESDLRPITDYLTALGRMIAVLRLNNHSGLRG